MDDDLRDAYRSFLSAFEKYSKSAGYRLSVSVAIVDQDDFGSEVRISGNADGLLCLSALMMKMAMSNDLSAHLHVDEAGIASPGSTPVVISKLSNE